MTTTIKRNREVPHQNAPVLSTTKQTQGKDLQRYLELHDHSPHCNNKMAKSFKSSPFGLILFATLFWTLKNIPEVVAFPAFSIQVPLTTSMERGLQSALPPVYNLMEKGNSSEELSKGGRQHFPKRNMWELISSSSDVLKRTNLNNASYTQWPGGGKTGSRSSSDNDAVVIDDISSTSRHHHLHHDHLSVESRLQKLEHHFNSLRVYDDDCRQRLLCEIAESPAKFAPLTDAFLDETSFNGDEKSLASKLLETKDGTKLLTYIEAAQRGVSRLGCEIWTYRCPRSASAMIDFKSLLIWREISKWLTIKFVSNNNKKPNF